MLSDNIRNNRKKINLSQDELAEKLGVSRQSVSFWETGQTQPTIDNIIALAKIFNISTDTLLGNAESESPTQESVTADNDGTTEKGKKRTGVIIGILAVILAGIIALVIASRFNRPSDDNSESTNNKVNQEDTLYYSGETNNGTTEKTNSTDNKNNSENANNNVGKDNSESVNNTSSADIPAGPVQADFDLFTYCKNFAIQKGQLNGDYCIYQQPATKYGGYDNEYFSISYWSDSDMVEFCLHCPLSETQSHNFYLRMRGGYNGKYEYTSSKYYRDTGESLRYADGYIDPAVFYDGYPIGCDTYEGSTDGQTEFMEQSRVGICDLIRCLKKFVTVENMECDFSDFDFVNF